MWPKRCEAMKAELKQRLQKKAGEDMSVQDVIKSLKQSNDQSESYREALAWLEEHLPLCVAQRGHKDEIVKAVVDVARAYSKVHKNTRKFRPVQLAAILLNVRAAVKSSPMLIQMKTGEGKTDVCAAVAATLFKRRPGYAVHIVTSSSDRAADDCKSARAFVREATGKDPTLAADGLKWGPEGAGVVYAQVTDIQKMVVDEMRNGKQKELLDWLDDCSLMVDEADHVLIEQSENQLYISSPCRGFRALDPLTYLSIAYMDFDADFSQESVKDTLAIPAKSQELAKKINDDLRKLVGAGQNGRWKHMSPVKVDEEACIATLVSGGLGARLKCKDKEFIIETQKEHGIEVPQVIIVDMATGTESIGTRWTSEAPAVEAFHALPVGGSDPLAFFNSIPSLARKYGWVGGVTGTLGQSHCLDFYAKVYNSRCSFQLPRNVPSCIYQLKPQIAKSQEDWLRNICKYAELYLNGQLIDRVTGPVLVITESILKAEQVLAHFKSEGYPIMKKVSEQWSQEGGPVAHLSNAHVFPYFKSSHEVMDKLPDASIVIASNKGGRGLDLKLDGACPAGCTCVHPHVPKPDAGRVLFVILTEVLNERQDVQARGRCGRSGKPGVIQYQLLDEGNQAHGDRIGHVLQVQSKKAQEESGQLASKADRVGDMVKEGRLLEKFVNWKLPYQASLMKALFPEGTTGLPAKEKLQQRIAKFIEDFVVERWAYWRTMGEPSRGRDDTLYHFRQRQVLGSLPKLDRPKQGCSVQAFAQRLWDVAAQLRLDAEQLYALAAALLPLAGETAKYARLSLDLLEKASSIDEPWSLQGEFWQAEWTGNAALLLAGIKAQLGQPGVEGALQSSIDRLKELEQSFKLGDDKFKQLADKQDHEFPKPVLQTNVEVRASKSQYGVQRDEKLRQIQHRMRQLQAAKSLPGLRLRHFSSLEMSVAPHLHLLGYDWAKAVFEWNVGDMLDPMCEPLQSWLADLRAVAKSAGAVHPVGAGGAGDAQARLFGLQILSC